MLFLKLERLGIGSVQLFMALQFTVFGFVIYYVVPMLIFYDKLEVLVYLVNLCLISMMIGIVVISNQLQPYGERFFISLLYKLCYKKKKNTGLEIVIKKNLKAHSKRNKLTALMIT